MQSIRKPVSGCGDMSRRRPAATTPTFAALLILGTHIGESLPTSPGHIRSYDAHSGALRWTLRWVIILPSAAAVLL
jgi:hypothetical protein